MERLAKRNLDKQNKSTSMQKALKCCVKLVNPFIFYKKGFLHLGLSKYSVTLNMKEGNNNARF